MSSHRVKRLQEENARLRTKAAAWWEYLQCHGAEMKAAAETIQQQAARIATLEAELNRRNRSA